MFSYIPIGEGKYLLAVMPPGASAYYALRSIKRADPSMPINLTELENIMGEAIWDAFISERSEFTKRERVPESEVVMADARVPFAYLDGKFVIDPVGLTGSEFKIFLSEILLTRTVSHKMRDATPEKGDVVHIFEPAPALALIINHDRPLKNSAFVFVSDNRTEIWHLIDKEKLAPLGFIDWEWNSLISILEKAFSISKGVAENMARLYFAGDMSENFSAGIGHYINNSLDHLVKDVTAMLENAKISVDTVRIGFSSLSQISSENIEFRLNGISFELVAVPSLADIGSSEMRISDTGNILDRIAKKRMRWLLCHR